MYTGFCGTVNTYRTPSNSLFLGTSFCALLCFYSIYTETSPRNGIISKRGIKRKHTGLKVSPARVKQENQRRVKRGKDTIHRKNRNEPRSLSSVLIHAGTCVDGLVRRLVVLLRLLTDSAVPTDQTQFLVKPPDNDTLVDTKKIWKFL